MAPGPDDSLTGAPGATAVIPMLSELLGEFDVLELLDRVLRHSAGLVGASSAAVLVPDGLGGLQVLAATTETARELELFQLMSGEGPAFDCVGSQQAVLAPDLETVAERWPAFVPAARSVGMTSVGSVHMGYRGTSVGALNLFDPEVDAVDGLRPVQALADVAVLAVMQAGREVDPTDVLEHVRRTLDRRVLVEQAKGVVAEWTGLTPAESGPVLLHHARVTGTPLEELALRVVHLQVDASSLQRPDGAASDVPDRRSDAR